MARILPKTPAGYKLFGDNWLKAGCNDDARRLKKRGYVTKIIKRREGYDPLKPKAKFDRYYLYFKKKQTWTGYPGCNDKTGGKELTEMLKMAGKEYQTVYAKLTLGA